MRKASEVISALFKERFEPEFMETARASAGLFSSWTQIVTEACRASTGGRKGQGTPSQNMDGPEPEDIPAVAVHSRIKELERGLLLVEADHPGWIQILQTKQQELLSVVERKYPEMGIRNIAFKLSREPF